MLGTLLPPPGDPIIARIVNCVRIKKIKKIKKKIPEYTIVRLSPLVRSELELRPERERSAKSAAKS